MSEELEQYITQSRAAGMDDAAIRQTLVDTGWQAELVDQHLTPKVAVADTVPVIPPVTAPITEHTPPVEPVKAAPARSTHWGLIIGIIIAVLILTVGALTVFAEKGYLPAFSKIYRKTNLPLVWHGTNNNAALALAQGISSSLSTKPVELTTDVTYYAVVDSSVSASLNAFAPKSSDNAFASVPAGKTTLQGALSVNIASDQAGTVSQGLNYDLKKDASLQKLLGSYLNPSFGNITIDSLFPATGTVGYARTNMLPTPTTADKGKWFSFPLPHGTTAIQSQQTAVKDLAITKDEQSALISFINDNTVDNGIIRHNNTAEAWYRTTLTGASLKQAEGDSHIPSSVRDWLKTYLDEGTNTETILIDWYMTPEHPQLSEMMATVKVHNPVSGDSTYTIDSHLKYGGSVTVQAIPTKDQTWSGVSAYFQALQTAGTNVADTGILSSSFYQQLLDSLGLGSSTPAGATLLPLDAGILEQ